MSVITRTGAGAPFAEAFLSLSPAKRRAADALLLEYAPLIQPRSEFFVLEEGGLPQARLGAAITRAGEAYLGFLEATPGAGPEMLSPLFASAKDWLRGAGARAVLAPIDLSTWFSYRIRLPDPVGTEPTFSWEPVHDGKLPLWENADFTLSERYTSRGWRSTESSLLLEIGRSGERCLRRLKRHGFTFERAEERDGAPTPETLRRVHELTNASFPGVPHFEPIGFDLFSRIYVLGAQGREHSRLVFCKSPDGADAGYIYCFRERDAVILKTIASPPAYRNKGVTAALIHIVADEAFRAGFLHPVSALVASLSHTPDHVSGGLSKLALSWVHEYGLLSCTL